MHIMKTFSSGFLFSRWELFDMESSEALKTLEFLYAIYGSFYAKV